MRIHRHTVAILLLSAMSIGAQPHTSTPGSKSKGCWSNLQDFPAREDEETAFDAQFDRTQSGESFSCDLGVRASVARRVIDDFRFGVLYRSARHLALSISFPIRIRVQKTLEIDEAFHFVTLNSPAEWLAFQEANLDVAHVALIGCASLRTVSIMKGRSYGFMLGSGFVWFQLSKDKSLRVTAVNVFPESDEALAEDCKGE